MLYLSNVPLIFTLISSKKAGDLKMIIGFSYKAKKKKILCLKAAARICFSVLNLILQNSDFHFFFLKLFFFFNSTTKNKESLLF